MTERTSRVSVRILEKEYQVACLPEERSELLDSAEYLNVKMREIRDGGNIVGLDRIAVMAALNLAHELLKLRGRGDLARADPHQIGALDGERAPRGVDPEHILEIVEADLVADGVVRAAQQIGGERLGGLERRRLLVLSGLWRADAEDGHAGQPERERRGAPPREPVTMLHWLPSPDATNPPRRRLYRQTGGSRKGPI
jgi:cell division protein ZapA